MNIQKRLLVFALASIISCLFFGALATTDAQNSEVSITLYAGDVSIYPGAMGYGNNSVIITSPGPTLNLQVGVTYNLTVVNVGDVAHSWEIAPTKAVTDAPLFGAGIATDNYIQPGQSASVTFTPTQEGNFYYVCTVPGHINGGMWGNVVVSTAVPEFPIPALLIAALVVTATAALVSRYKIRSQLESGKPNIAQQVI